MSLQGLRFTLQVHGQEADTFAVVNFWSPNIQGEGA